MVLIGPFLEKSAIKGQVVFVNLIIQRRKLFTEKLETQYRAVL